MDWLKKFSDAIDESNNARYLHECAAPLESVLLDYLDAEPKTLRDDLKIVQWDGDLSNIEVKDCGYRIWRFFRVDQCHGHFIVLIHNGDYWRLNKGTDYVVTKSAIIPLSELLEV